MSGFITVGRAARLLAACNGVPGDASIWVSLLIERADALRAVKTWTDHCSSALAPGGIAYQRSPQEWRVPIFLLRQWCEQNGFGLGVESFEPSSLGAAKPVSIAKPKTGRRGMQIATILDQIAIHGWDPLCIPRGGKQRLLAECLKQSNLFSEAAFGHAWKEAGRAGLLCVKDHSLYAGK